MKIEFFKLSFDKILLRYYLMMVVAIAPFFLGVPFMSLLAVPIFFSSIMGIKISIGNTPRSIEMNNVGELSKTLRA